MSVLTFLVRPPGTTDGSLYARMGQRSNRVYTSYYTVVTSIWHFVIGSFRTIGIVPNVCCCAMCVIISYASFEPACIRHLLVSADEAIYGFISFYIEAFMLGPISSVHLACLPLPAPAMPMTGAMAEQTWDPHSQALDLMSLSEKHCTQW